MAITEQDKRAIDEAVAELYFVKTDEEGNKSFDPFYTDYHDTNDFLIQKAYNLRNAAFEKKYGELAGDVLLDALKEEIAGVYQEQMWDIEDEIMRKAGFDPSDDMAEEQISYLREAYIIDFPYDHYLNQSVLVNVMLGPNEESNLDFGAIKQQEEALSGAYSAEDTKDALAWDTGLRFLVEQQGHTMEQLQEVYKAFNDTFYNGNTADLHFNYNDRYKEFCANRNPFLCSVAQELDNTTNVMTTMTILAKMDLYQFAEMMKPDKEITFPKNAMVGIFAPWVGGGSILEVELEKDLVIPSDKIWDVQIEGTDLDQVYSVDSVFGLVKNCWQEVTSIQDAEPTKKPALDSMICNAQKKVAAPQEKNTPAKEQGRY